MKIQIFLHNIRQILFIYLKLHHMKYSEYKVEFNFEEVIHQESILETSFKGLINLNHMNPIKSNRKDYKIQ